MVTVGGLASSGVSFTVTPFLTAGTTSYDTYWGTPTDPFTGGGWESANSGDTWTQRTFGGTYTVTGFYLGSVNTDGNLGTLKYLYIKLEQPGGTWITADTPTLNGTNTFGPYTKTLAASQSAIAFEVDFSGTGGGWSGASDIGIMGY